MELFGSNIFGFRRREVKPPIPGIPSSTVENDQVKGGSFEEAA